MGEYADEHYRREIQSLYGFDPGSMYDAPKKNVKVIYGDSVCKKCGKRCANEAGLKQHENAKHNKVTNVQAVR